MSTDVGTPPVAQFNGNGAINGNGYPLDTPKEPRFASGLILPPPEIKCEGIRSCSADYHLLCIPSLFSAVIDRTASFVARSANPPQFEDKIRENQRQDPKFSFLNPADPYHAYYRHRMEKVLRGELDDETAVGREEETPQGEVAPEKEVDMGLEPPAPEFILDVTNINPLDLYVSSFYCCTFALPAFLLVTS